MTLRVLSRGLGSTVQDLGRIGFGHLGVTGSGAVDPDTVMRLNRSLGNDPGSAVIETAGGLRLVAESPVEYVRDGDIGPSRATVGTEIRVDPQPGRMWGYLAVRGGIAGSPVLGSLSTDVLSGISAIGIDDGGLVPIGTPAVAPIADVTVPMAASRDAIDISAGPRGDWLEDGALGRLVSEVWTIAESNRVGVRLDGVPIGRSRPEELRSEGLVAGAIQIPGSGLPLVMGRDHPTTGGYPVLAVVTSGDLGRLMQLPVGSRVRFRHAPT